METLVFPLKISPFPCGFNHRILQRMPQFFVEFFTLFLPFLPQKFHNSNAGWYTDNLFFFTKILFKLSTAGFSFSVEYFIPFSILSSLTESALVFPLNSLPPLSSSLLFFLPQNFATSMLLFFRWHFHPSSLLCKGNVTFFRRHFHLSSLLSTTGCCYGNVSFSLTFSSFCSRSFLPQNFRTATLFFPVDYL